MEIPDNFLIVLLGIFFTMFVLMGVWRHSRAEGERKAALRFEQEREKTHREITRLVGEGALTTEQAERLIRAMAHADSADAAQREVDLAAAAPPARA